MKINHWADRDRKGRFNSFKASVKRFFRACGLVAVGAIVLFIAFTTGAATYSTSKVEAEFSNAPLNSAVLNRIADCESGNGKPGSATHYDKNGQVLLRANKNGTVDVGKYQVNSVWFKKATELGYDITKESDNKAMAEWVYLNRGTGDWYSSQKCWQR
jgi:hypothetical protein